MTETISTTTGGRVAIAELTALLADVRRGAVSRERDRVLLYEEIEALRGLGFPAARLPIDAGGSGWSLEGLFEALIDIAAADSNLAHVWRGHIAFVEGVLIDEARSGGSEDGPWLERIARGDIVGNAQSERQELAEITTRLIRTDAGVRLTGTKYYTTGSIYADWIHLAALDGDTRVGVNVRSTDHGVRSIDDWDGFGQRLTGSGTTVFDDVPVEEHDITVPGADPTVGSFIAAVFQLTLLAVVAGIAQAALDDTVAFVRPRRRTFGFAGETPPRDDALVQSVVGALSSAAHASRALVLREAAALDRLARRLRAGEDVQEEAQALLLDVFRLQQVLLPLVLDATTELFEVGGASAVGRDIGLDRHWRNARTIASHNPAAQRRRAIGQWELNGSLPDWHAPAAPTVKEDEA